MNTYEVLLEAPDSPQTRLVKLDAAGIAEARAEVERLEAKHTAFSLLPPAREVWEDPHRHDSIDGHVDLSLWDQHDRVFGRETATHTSYEDAVRAGKRRISEWNGRAEVVNGKIVATNLGKRSRARLLAHRQVEPYTIADVREITQAEKDRGALIRELLTLQEHDPSQWPTVLEEMRAAGIHLNAVTAFLYGLTVQTINDGSLTQVVYSSNTMKCSLHTAYSANNDTHDFFDDASASEITGTGYTTLGVTLASKTSTYDTASDQIRLDAADPSWTTSTLSATDAVIFKTTGTASTSPMLSNIDFGATVTTTAGTFQITLDATGHYVLDVT